MENDDFQGIQISIRINISPSKQRSIETSSVTTPIRNHQPGEIWFPEDPLLEQAKKIVIESQQGSVSILQRKLRIGYSRAASLIDKLEELGVVGPFRGSEARIVLIQ